METLFVKQSQCHYTIVKRKGIHTLLIKLLVIIFYFVISSATTIAQDAKSYYDQGYEKEGAKKFKEAIKLFDKAIALKPDFAMAWLDRGNCKSSLGLFKEALADYDQAVKLDS